MVYLKHINLPLTLNVTHVMTLALLCMIHVSMILNYDRKTVYVYITTVCKSKAELISYVTNQTNQ